MEPLGTDMPESSQSRSRPSQVRILHDGVEDPRFRRSRHGQEAREGGQDELPGTLVEGQARQVARGIEDVVAHPVSGRDRRARLEGRRERPVPRSPVPPA